MVLVGDLRGLGATRVDHDHPPSARVQVAHPLREVGHRHQRAVGGHRVRPDDQEPRRAVDVGDRQEELVAEHQVRHELVGELVDRGRGVAVPRPEGLEHRGAVGHRAEAVGVGVAEVDPERVVAVVVDHPGDVVGHQVEGLVPADLLPARVRTLADAAHGAAQPVGVGVHVTDGHALGAHVPARERVGGVAAHADDVAPLDRDLEAADGLAEVAHADPLLRCHVAIVARPGPGGQAPRRGVTRGAAQARLCRARSRPGASPTEWSTSWVSEGRSA